VYPVPVAKGPVTGSQTQITFGPDGKPRNQQSNAITSATGATQSQGGFIGADGKLVVSNLQNSLRNFGYFPQFPFYPSYNPYVPSYAPAPVKKPLINKPAVVPIKKPAPVVYPVPVAKGPVTGSQTQITFGPDGKPRNQQNNAISSATGATQSQGGFVGADGKLVVSNLQNSLRNFGYYPSFFPSYPSPYAAPSYPSPYAPPAIQKPSYPFPPYPSLPKLGKGPVTGSQTQISFGPDGVIRKKNIQNFNGNQGTQAQNAFTKPDGTVGGGNNQQFSRDLAESEPTILEKIVKLLDVQS